MEQKETEKGKLKKDIATLEKVQNTLQKRKDNFKYMQRQLEKKLEELEDKTEFKNYLEGFDKVFETHTVKRIKETPLQLKLFNTFAQEIYQPTKLQEKITKVKKEIIKAMIQPRKPTTTNPPRAYSYPHLLITTPAGAKKAKLDPK